jgi:VIT1/CCC1 family predicted Fe2+/Mn2+ transporter
MIIAALGCNIAWGIIDAVLYLMSCLDDRARVYLTVQASRRTATPEEGRRAVADALPEPLAAALSPDDLDAIRNRLSQLPHAPDRPRLTAEDMLGALCVALVVILSTFPVVLPFLFIDQVGLALRISNAIGIVLLFLCGYAFGRATGLRPWLTGLTMVALGTALVGVAIALGG